MAFIFYIPRINYQLKNIACYLTNFLLTNYCCELLLLPTFDVVIAGLDADLGHHGGERHGGGRGVPGLPGGLGSSLAAPGLADVLLAGAEGRVGHPVPEVVLAGPEIC